MQDQQAHLDHLKEIRNMMERSSRFISLSGLSGVFVGTFALIGAAAAYFYMQKYGLGIGDDVTTRTLRLTPADFYLFFFLDAGLVLLGSILVSTWLTLRKARKAGTKVWDATAKRVFWNMMIPLATGGLLCLIFLWHGAVGFIAPAMLVFYGLALVNASKYTFNDLRFLGLSEIVLGLASALYVGHGLIFWSVGFGILHILYGIIMYYKYDR